MRTGLRQAIFVLVTSALLSTSISVAMAQEKPPKLFSSNEEMQVTIEMSANKGEDYFVFDNFEENGGGYIHIDRLDEPEGIVSGTFSGKFFDGATGEDRSVQLEGSFAVRRQ